MMSDFDIVHYHCLGPALFSFLAAAGGEEDGGDRAGPGLAARQMGTDRVARAAPPLPSTAASRFDKRANDSSLARAVCARTAPSCARMSANSRFSDSASWLGVAPLSTTFALSTQE